MITTGTVGGSVDDEGKGEGESGRRAEDIVGIQSLPSRLEPPPFSTASVLHMEDGRVDLLSTEYRRKGFREWIALYDNALTCSPEINNLLFSHEPFPRWRKV